MSKPKEPPGRIRFLSDDERDRLFIAYQESNNKDLYLAVVFALCTGMRKTELMSLRWEDIDLQRKMKYCLKPRTMKDVAYRYPNPH